MTHAPLDETQQAVLKHLLRDGLPLSPQPYQVLASQIGTSEMRVMRQCQQWLEEGMIKRHGVVVQHRSLGYCANAMVVWDIPDSVVDDFGDALSEAELVTLCYRRERRLPDWPYNFYCMIHGRDRDTVTRQVDSLTQRYGLQSYPRSILFSTRQYKQCGGLYGSAPGDSWKVTQDG